VSSCLCLLSVFRCLPCLRCQCAWLLVCLPARRRACLLWLLFFPRMHLSPPFSFQGGARFSLPALQRGSVRAPSRESGGRLPPAVKVSCNKQIKPAQQQQQTAATPQRPTASDTQLLMVQIYARQRFRALVRQFVSFHKDQPPNAWRKLKPLDPNHPFIGMASNNEGAAANAMRLNMMQATDFPHGQLPDH
jgi:hypothetical protein